VVVGVAGAISTAWSLLTGLGVGIGLIPFALLLVVAALISWADRRGADSSTSAQS
jgi:hypothetical protein